MTSDLADSMGLKQVNGVIVSSVSSDSAADRAGMKQGDVIVSFNGAPVQDFNALRNRVADVDPGSTVNVVVLRDGSERTLHVKLDEANPSKSASRESSPSDRDDKAALGITVSPMTPDLAEQAGVPRGTRGVFVENVNPEGRAADAGIQSGDVIEQINRQPVQSIDELRAAVRKSAERPVLLLVNRSGHELFVTVRPS
jgi:serine protease Do